jgi:hypothetical protein
MNISDKIIECVNRELSSLPNMLGTAVILNEENPLDPSTPVGVPMKMSGMGTGGKHITYPLTGWDQIRKTDDDPYIILSDSNGMCYVVRTSTSHSTLFGTGHLGRAIEDAAVDAESQILENIDNLEW